MAVEAAAVIFGRCTTEDGPRFLDRWLKKTCLDFRLRVVDGRHTVDLLLFKASTRHWLANSVQIYAKRWGFERTQYDHGQIRVMSREEYLASPTPRLTGLVENLLGAVYKVAANRADGIAENREKVAAWVAREAAMTEEEKQARKAQWDAENLKGQKARDERRKRARTGSVRWSTDR